MSTEPEMIDVRLGRRADHREGFFIRGVDAREAIPGFGLDELAIDKQPVLVADFGSDRFGSRGVLKEPTSACASQIKALWTNTCAQSVLGPLRLGWLVFRCAYASHRAF